MLATSPTASIVRWHRSIPREIGRGRRNGRLGILLRLVEIDLCVGQIEGDVVPDRGRVRKCRRPFRNAASALSFFAGVEIGAAQTHLRARHSPAKESWLYRVRARPACIRAAREKFLRAPRGRPGRADSIAICLRKAAVASAYFLLLVKRNAEIFVGVLRRRDSISSCFRKAARASSYFPTRR